MIETSASTSTLSRSNSEVGVPTTPAAIQPATPLQQDPSKRLGYFAHSPHYLKLFDMMKGVHNSVSGASIENLKEVTLLRQCLSCLSSILEFSLANNVGKHTEEVLQNLKTVFNVVKIVFERRDTEPHDNKHNDSHHNSQYYDFQLYGTQRNSYVLRSVAVLHYGRILVVLEKDNYYYYTNLLSVKD
jgi:hypothetical protein